MAKAAEGGSLQNLEIAYAMNAFADHYFGDCFAAGHMRTPRGFLHAEGSLALSAAWKTMNLPMLAMLRASDLCSEMMTAVKSVWYHASKVVWRQLR